jgi:hypothetical protein
MPYPAFRPPLSAEELERYEQITAKLDAARGLLETAYENWDSLSAAQKDEAMKRTIRAVAALTRFVLYRLDSAGI